MNSIEYPIIFAGDFNAQLGCKLAHDVAEWDSSGFGIHYRRGHLLAAWLCGWKVAPVGSLFPSGTC